MSPRLPDFIDPWRLADLGKKFSGRVALAELPRLSEVLAEVDGEAGFDLEFFRGEHRRPCVEGNVRASLSVQCQRCLEPMTIEVDSKLAVAFVRSHDEADRVPEPYDAVYLEEDGDGLRLLDLVEDELLLAIPQAPMHPEDECTVRLSAVSDASAEPTSDDAEKDANPFAVLAALKRDKS